MESKRCGYTLFGGIVVILALCSISTVRGDDWDDELEFATDKSEARLLNLNSTSLPDSYVSHFWFKALSIGFWSNVVHTKISLHESSTCVYRWYIMYIKPHLCSYEHCCLYHDPFTHYYCTYLCTFCTYIVTLGWMLIKEQFVN